MSEDNDERASNRLAAETFMPIMVEAFHDGLHEVASLSRWLLATLVVINGAATIAVLPLRMAGGTKLAAARSVCSWNLGGGRRWTMVVVRVQAREHRREYNDGLLVGDCGRRPARAALEATLKRHMDQAIGSRGTHFFVFASVAAFLAGCAFTGWGLLSVG